MKTVFCFLLLIFLIACQGKPKKATPVKKTPPPVKKLTEAEFEKVYDLKRRLGNSLKKVPGLHGKSFLPEKDCCKPKGKVKFTFEKGYQGLFKYEGFSRRGMYVKIKAQPDKNCCQNTKVIQIKRGYTPGKPLPKWKIDGPGDSPYATDYEFATEGKGGKPATVFDIPGRQTTTKNRKVEYITIILCVTPGKPDTPLAYVHWGFELDGTPKLTPKSPVVGCGAPKGLKEAIAGWNHPAVLRAFPKRKKANVTIP